jgi:hypothetical protein
MNAGARRRPLAALGGGLLCGLMSMAAVTGCSSEVVGQASEAGSSSTAGSPSPAAGTSTGSLADVEDLSAALLPAEAFGPGARATPITAGQVAQGQDQLGGLGLDDLTITPDSCAPAVKGTQPGLDDLAALGAQTVTTGSGATVEILAAGPGIADGVDQLASTVDTCPQATISSAQIGTATVTFAALDVPDLGDGSAGLIMTMSITGPTGEPLTVPVLLGMAKDGDRLVSLTATDATGAADPAAFAALLQQAFDHQEDTLD